MKDRKRKRRLELLHHEIRRDCARYETECKDKGTHMITEEERMEYERKMSISNAPGYLANILKQKENNGLTGERVYEISCRDNLTTKDREDLEQLASIMGYEANEE